MNGTMPGKTAVLPVLIAVGTAWGAAFILIKVLVEDISPTEMVAGRMLLAALTVLAIVPLRGARLPSNPRIVLGVAALAVLDSVVPYTLVGWAETRIEGGVAAVLISTMPLFTIILAATFLRERIRGPQIAGVVVGFVGVAIVARAGSGAITDGEMAGNLAVIGAALSYAAATVIAGLLLRTEDPLGLTALKLGIGAAVAVVLSLAIDGAPGYGALDAQGWAALVALGVVCTGAAFVAFVWIVANAGPFQASLVTYIVPVSGLLIGWLALGEPIAAQTVVGIPLIAAGLAMVKYKCAIISALRKASLPQAVRPRGAVAWLAPCGPQE